MSSSPTCPRCFAPMRASESPEGLCPKCLLAVAMGEDAVLRTSTGSAVPAPPTIEELTPHFEGLQILALIGRGGAGAVYRAVQKDLGRQVALKVLLLDPETDPTFGERFLREARALASLSHPNIAGVHDAGRAGPYWFLVLELVDGPNLRQLIHDRELTSVEALDVVRQICSALEYAHGEGVVHRDVKPENVLVDARGRVKLVDFGLAKLLRPELSNATLTRSSQAMGTWQYMAPEQLRRPLEVDHRADIYSLGVVLYELLTGEVPQGRYAPVSQRARADRRLDAIVDRALEQDPARRYQEARGVREDVERVQNASGPPPLTRRERRAERAGIRQAAHEVVTPSAWKLLLAIGCFGLLAIPIVIAVILATTFDSRAKSAAQAQADQIKLVEAEAARREALLSAQQGSVFLSEEERLALPVPPEIAAVVKDSPEPLLASTKETLLETYFAHQERVRAATSLRYDPERVDGAYATVEAFPEERGTWMARLRALAAMDQRVRGGQSLADWIPFGGEAVKGVPVQLGSEAPPGDVTPEQAALYRCLSGTPALAGARLWFDPEAVGLPALLKPEAREALARAWWTYRGLERRAFLRNVGRNLRAAGGSRPMGWELLAIEDEPTPIRGLRTRMEPFPVAREQLLGELAADLKRAGVAEFDLDRIARTLAPFGERPLMLHAGRYGAWYFLVGEDETSGDLRTVWAGRRLDFRYRRFFLDHRDTGISSQPVLRDADDYQAVLVDLDVDSGEDLVPRWRVFTHGLAQEVGELPVLALEHVRHLDAFSLDPGRTFLFPSKGAEALLGGAPSPLLGDPALVPPAETAWGELLDLVEGHRHGTFWKEGETRWLQIDVDAFPDDLDAWKARYLASIAAVAGSGDEQHPRDVLAREVLADLRLPGAHARAELHVSDSGVHVFGGAASRELPLAQELQSGLVEDDVQATIRGPFASEYDRARIHACWPFEDVPAPYEFRAALQTVVDDYHAIERAHWRTHYDVTGVGSIRVDVEPFPVERAGVLLRLLELRELALASYPERTPTEPALERLAPFGDEAAVVWIDFNEEGPHVRGMRVPSAMLADDDALPLTRFARDDLATEAELFCDPRDLGLPPDLPAVARWALTSTRREYQRLVLANSQRIVPSGPRIARPESGSVQVANAGPVLRVLAFGTERDLLLAELQRDLDEAGVQPVDADRLREQLLFLGAENYDLRAHEEAGTWWVKARVAGSDSETDLVLYEADELGWRWWFLPTD